MENSPAFRRVITVPNLLSLVRVLLIPVFFVYSVRGEFRLALIIFVTAALTDVVDGYLARRLNQRSQIGAVLDPAADKILMIVGFITYTLHDAVMYPLPGWLTLTIFTRDAAIVFVAYLLFTRMQIRRFPPTIAGKISTVTQAVALSVAILVNAVPSPGWRLFAELLFPAALIATLYSSAGYLLRADAMLRKSRETGVNAVSS